MTGGGIFVHNGVSSTVALEFSGQTVFDPQSPERLTFTANDVDGSLTALNGSTQTTINAVALSDLEQIDGVDGDGVKGDGNYAFTGTGKAWVKGVTTAIAIRISFNQGQRFDPGSDHQSRRRGVLRRRNLRGCPFYRDSAGSRDDIHGRRRRPRGVAAKAEKDSTTVTPAPHLDLL